MQRFINNWGDTLTAQALVGATTVTVSLAKATLINDASVTKYYLATFMSAGADNPDEVDIEVVKITGADGGTGNLTIVRAQEGTVAKQWEIDDTIDILISAGGLRGVQHEYQPGFVQGTNYVRDAVDGYHIEPGKAVVNGTLLEWTANITRSALVLTASTLYYVYLYDNAGTPAVEESTTVPVWDADFQYWKKTGDDTRRYIGFLPVDGSSNLHEFTVLPSGRRRSFLFTTAVLASADGRRIINGGASTAAWASIDLSQFVPSNADELYAMTALGGGAAAWEAIVGIDVQDLGVGATVGAALYQVRDDASAGTVFTTFGSAWLSLTSQTIYYRLQQYAGTPLVYLDIKGSRFEV